MKSVKQEKSYKPLWYVLSFIGVTFIAVLLTGATGLTNLELTLLYGNNASNQNITGVDYLEANYFVGDGSQIENIDITQIVTNYTGNKSPLCVNETGHIYIGSSGSCD